MHYKQSIWHTSVSVYLILQIDAILRSHMGSIQPYIQIDKITKLLICRKFHLATNSLTLINCNRFMQQQTALLYMISSPNKAPTWYQCVPG